MASKNPADCDDDHMATMKRAEKSARLTLHPVVNKAWNPDGFERTSLTSVPTNPIEIPNTATNNSSNKNRSTIIDARKSPPKSERLSEATKFSSEMSLMKIIEKRSRNEGYGLDDDGSERKPPPESERLSEATKCSSEMSLMKIIEKRSRNEGYGLDDDGSELKNGETKKSAALQIENGMDKQCASEEENRGGQSEAANSVSGDKMEPVLDYPQDNSGLRQDEVNQKERVATDGLSARLRPGAYRGAPGASFVHADSLRYSTLGRQAYGTGCSSKELSLNLDLEKSVKASARYSESTSKGLSVATPVDEISAIDLPAAEEMDASEIRTIPEEDAVSRSKRQRMAFSVLAVTVLCGVVLLIVFLVTKKDSEPAATGASPQTTVAPTLPPTFSPADYVLQMLPVSTSRTVQLDPESPQAQALQWILDDPRPPQTFELYRVKQRFALATLYYATDGDTWISNDYWLDYVDECEWFSHNTSGIYSFPETQTDLLYQESGGICDEEGHMIHLWLWSNGLHGSIPDETFLLTNLRSISLDRNSLEGTISTNIGSVADLEALALFATELSGSLPSQLGLLSQMRFFWTMASGFDGSMPTELGRLSQLEYLLLDSNRLTGQIPSEIGSMSLLEWFWLYDNQLTGTIPTEIGMLSSVDQIWFTKNDLTGPLPSELGYLRVVQGIIVNDNELSGTIPSELSNIPSLVMMDVTMNSARLSGTVPSELCDLGVEVSCPFNSVECGLYMTCNQDDIGTLCGCDCPCS